MRKRNHLLYVLSILLLTAVVTSPTAEAQFFKKVTQGLEKVNKGLKKVDEGLQSVEKLKGKKKDNKKKENQRNASAEEQSADRTVQSKQPARKVKKSGNWHDNVPTPHLTWQTKFIEKNLYYDNLRQPREGIFAIQEYNRSIGYSSYFGFWTVDGKCLFPAIYESFTRGYPRFDSGACVVKATGTKRHSPVILYADGTQKNLSHEWEEMTQFYDGVAMVREIIDYRTINLFYINTKGEKIWPHLAENGATGSIALEMRPLREGLRAFYSNKDKGWGFLNENGTVAIKPQFHEVRDFKNGYALVFPKSNELTNPFFIDKKGNKVVTVPRKASGQQYATTISDISNGYFLLNKTFEDPARFYNLNGEVVAEYPEASGFADGNAFVQLKEYSDDVYVVNTNFDIVGRWPFKCTYHGFQGFEIQFDETPYYTYDDKIAINAAGEPTMYVPYGTLSDNRLGQFAPDGFAWARSVFKDPNNENETLTYTGIVDTEGNYRVVFSDKKAAEGPFNGRLPGPQPRHPEPWDSVPKQPDLPPGDTIPAGPKGPGEEGVRYHVTVKAMPSEGGVVYGTGEYAYGDTIRVTGKAAEGWKLSLVECSRPASKTDVFNRFVVLGDMDITCWFTKKDDTEEIKSGIGPFGGALPTMEVPVYMAIGKDGNKFSDPTQGYLVVEFDDNTINMTNTERNTSGTINVFFVPMNVLGIEKESGHTYLRLDGGIIKYSNFGVRDESAMGLFNNPFLSMMLAFDGADQGELQPGAYRVEIVDGSPEKGEMTLGRMQRKSVKYGWIDADDESFHKPLGGFFVRRVDKGLGGDFFDGVVLKKTGSHNISWEPSEAFYGGQPSMMQNFAAALGKLFRRTVADTPYEDYNMMDFERDLDNHLFKMK